MNKNAGKYLAITFSAVVVLAVAAGIAVNPPSEVRAKKLDERRVRDLNNISSAVANYWHRDKKLPADLEILKKEPGFNTALVDPDARPYTYKITGGRAYRLCAMFSLDVAKGGEMSVLAYNHMVNKWAHRAGQQCFDVTVEDKQTFAISNVVPSVEEPKK